MRKLKHELGIESEQVCVENFKYLGRIHYCAADSNSGSSSTYNSSINSTGIDNGSSVWGEHEIDYILFIKATVDLRPNSEEVRLTFYKQLLTLELTN